METIFPWQCRTFLVERREARSVIRILFHESCTRIRKNGSASDYPGQRIGGMENCRAEARDEGLVADHRVTSPAGSRKMEGKIG
ncbi:MAG: hypothetical protein EXS39_02115 [Opitutaceae bacterium]|nr:hypothetical protein [Opitutaceae bacterium]